LRQNQFGFNATGTYMCLGPCGALQTYSKMCEETTFCWKCWRVLERETM